MKIDTTPSCWVVRLDPSMHKELSREDYKFFATKARKVFKHYKTKAAAQRAVKRNQNYFSGVDLHVCEQFWLVFK